MSKKPYTKIKINVDALQEDSPFDDLEDIDGPFECLDDIE